jgi:hypothetical protein
MARNVNARLADGPPPPGGEARPVRRPPQSDPFWQQVMVVLATLLVIGLGIRLYQALVPAEMRYGVTAVKVPDVPGPLQVSVSGVPELSEIGGCVVLRTRGRDLFLVRTGASTFVAYDVVSRNGKPIKYQPQLGVFIYATLFGSRTQFASFSGKPVDEKSTNDSLLAAMTTCSGDMVTIVR